MLNPSKYLGINFKLRGKRVADFQDIVDKVQGKFQGWKAKLLSQAGRTTLIASVLQAMPLYVFSCFKVFLIDNNSFIEEKEQCVYDCKLITLETNTIKSKREPNREKEIRQ